LCRGSEVYFVESEALQILDDFRKAMCQLSLAITARNDLQQQYYENVCPQVIAPSKYWPVSIYLYNFPEVCVSACATHVIGRHRQSARGLCASAMQPRVRGHGHDVHNLAGVQSTDTDRTGCAVCLRACSVVACKLLIVSLFAWVQTVRWLFAPSHVNARPKSSPPVSYKTDLQYKLVDCRGVYPLTSWTKFSVPLPSSPFSTHFAYSFSPFLPSLSTNPTRDLRERRELPLGVCRDGAQPKIEFCAF